MKRVMLYITISICHFVSWGLADSTSNYPSHPITMRIFVHRPDGMPVEGAMVSLSSTYYRGKEITGKDFKQITANDGFAVINAVTEFEYTISVVKSGYYRTNGPHRTIDTEESFRKYASGVQELSLELRPILSPIAAFVGSTVKSNKPLPSMNQPVGYDLVADDWIAPWGKGEQADFVFQVSGYAKAWRDHDQSLSLSFSNPGDGIQSFTYPKDEGSEFIFPYEAPIDGYAPSRVWRSQNNASGRQLDSESSLTHYIFRIRTELNPDGSVKRALYGVIPNGLLFSPGVDKVGAYFIYRLNPGWTRNLEFDPEMSASEIAH